MRPSSAIAGGRANGRSIAWVDPDYVILADPENPTGFAIADTFFLADGPNFTWEEVAIGAATFATLSGIAVLLLVVPFKRRSE